MALTELRLDDAPSEEVTRCLTRWAGTLRSVSVIARRIPDSVSCPLPALEHLGIVIAKTASDPALFISSVRQLALALRTVAVVRL